MAAGIAQYSSPAYIVNLHTHTCDGVLEFPLHIAGTVTFASLWKFVSFLNFYQSDSCTKYLPLSASSTPVHFVICHCWQLKGNSIKLLLPAAELATPLGNCGSEKLWQIAGFACDLCVFEQICVCWWVCFRRFLITAVRKRLRCKSTTNSISTSYTGFTNQRLRRNELGSDHTYTYMAICILIY